MALKICRHCRWRDSEERCRNPKNKPNLVTGSTHPLCAQNRLDPFPLEFFFGTCGVVGRWWEEKTEAPENR